ncbi:MAG: hypothetical protein JKY03_14950 [Aureispira sp.]|nr:hypothetical protein [Aureispira sp.]
MRNIILAFCLSSILISCQGNNAATAETNLAIPAPQDIPLNVSLNMTQANYQLGQPITLRFVLKNNTPETVTFCKLNSPANDQHWSNCFEIKDAKGANISFIGKIATSKGPVEDKDLISIEGNGIRLYTIDIRPMYALNQVGTYKIRFIGDQINLLANSLPARLIIK